MSRSTTGEVVMVDVLPVGVPVPSLVRWGLTCDGDLVYRTLATFGERTAPELVTELGLTARRVHAALAELHEAGAATCRSWRGAVAHRPIWTAVPPGEVVPRLRARRMRTGEVPGRAAPRVAAAARDYVGEGVRHLVSREDTRRRLAGLVAIERHEQLSINPEPAFDAASARAAAPLDRDLVTRGVKLRILGVPPADRDLHVDATLLDAARYGYREAAELPLKLIVVDRRVAFFPADPGDLERGYLEVSHPAMVRSLVALFERHWASAVDPREHGMPGITLSERELELVNLLAQGHTDVSAAAELRISARTVTSTMRALMDRVAVENRFQLGLALGTMRAAGPSATGES
ncbi:helix-turn-helix transcriptional regulator [Actinoplanes sp. NPDC051861]|uniref:helix-turn-helix transcriptional regulator n=1 Tax=Actinoplanes sp. NPDC051861 TaxID=3155170 RepID=UPI00342665DA